VERYLGGLRLPGRTGALLDAIEDIWSRGGGLPAVVRELRIPVTLAWGEHDRTIPFRYSGPLRGYVSGTGPVIIGGCGHSAPLERPDVISRLIAEATSVP
jgi:pimeloyl-ACP methyl ester carboxylesterase